MNSYIKLGIAAFIPVIASVIFYLLEDKTKFKKLPYFARQIIIGIVFGCIAILGTEWGIPMNGAQMNCRDAAPLCAGLLFGAPAGIIAGVIGAVERWFAVYWGVGTFTRVACSLATLLAGLYAALLRKFLFDNKRPSWALTFAAGVIIEVLHLTLVFVTNINEAANAAKVVEICTGPLLTANSLSVLCAAIFVAAISKDKIKFDRENLSITQTIQRWLLAAVVLAFLITTAFLYSVQTGISKSQTSTLLSQAISEANENTADTKIGNTGSIFTQKKNETINFTNTKSNEMIETEYNGDKVFAMYIDKNDTQLVAVLPEEEAFETRDISLYINTFMEILVFAVLFLLIYSLIKRVVIKRMHTVNDKLDEITSGNLDVVVDVSNTKEWLELSTGINRTVDSLKHYIAEAEARLNSELEFAKNVQLATLPVLTKRYTKRPEFDIFAKTIPAREVGGDFYDFYFTKKDKFNIEIADVSGKGIPAAMFMMRAKTLIKSLGENDAPVENSLSYANRGLYEGNDASMFVTAWLASIDLEEGILNYSNAGHNPPLIKRADGRFEYINNIPGFVLGGLDSAKYEQDTINLNPGDIVFLYTDGITEANNEQNELYGENRLVEALNAAPLDSMESIINYIKDSVDTFAGAAPQFDDITMLAFKYNGPAPKIEIRFDEAEIANVTEITAFVEEELEKMGCPMKTTIQLNIAIDEIYSNIVKYAYKDKKGPATVRLEDRHEPRGVLLTFIDEGVPYNLRNAEAPDITLSAEEREIGGLGIYMVKQSMDDIIYEYKKERNVLHLFKKFDK